MASYRSSAYWQIILHGDGENVSSFIDPWIDTGLPFDDAWSDLLTPLASIDSAELPTPFESRRDEIIDRVALRHPGFDTNLNKYDNTAFAHDPPTLSEDHPSTAIDDTYRFPNEMTGSRSRSAHPQLAHIGSQFGHDGVEHAQRSGNENVGNEQSSSSVDGRHRTVDKNHHCLSCGKSFRYPKDLRRHEGIHASNRQNSHYCPHGECEYAIKGFPRKDSLTRHLRNKHD